MLFCYPFWIVWPGVVYLLDKVSLCHPTTLFGSFYQSSRPNFPRWDSSNWSRCYISCHSLERCRLYSLRCRSTSLFESFYKAFLLGGTVKTANPTGRCYILGRLLDRCCLGTVLLPLWVNIYQVFRPSFRRWDTWQVLVYSLRCRSTTLFGSFYQASRLNFTM